MAEEISSQVGDVFSDMRVQEEVGGLSNSESFISANDIDLPSLTNMSPILSSTKSLPFTRREVWEIDPSKLSIMSVIAKGTYGIVYRGVYDGQDVAVKVLDWGEDGMETAAETLKLRASFHQEVSVWHKLDHPNVAKFVGASIGTSDLNIPSETKYPAQACCVVVEYLNGGTLRNFVRKHAVKKLPFKTVVQFGLDLARGLSYLHSKDIVHRDVKTENMLLLHGTLKITDFGVARVEAENPKDMTTLTGTLGYMAPEVLDGKPYNRKCDVYSFGICLWEIYCSKLLPYGNLSFAELASAVVTQHLRPNIPRCCPVQFANIMRKCWDPNPSNRPEMEDVVQLLEHLDTSKGGGMIPAGQSSCFCFGPKRGP